MKLCIHSTHGPESPSKADRAFLIAGEAIDEGHTVELFLAGTAVELFAPGLMEQVLGLGEEAVALQERMAKIISAGGRIVAARPSCAARGIELEAVLRAGAELGEPVELIRMTADCDKLITYG